MPRLGMCSNNLNYNSRILNLLEHAFFTVYISYTCVECGKDVMSSFASSSSYSNLL